LVDPQTLLYSTIQEQKTSDRSSPGYSTQTYALDHKAQYKELFGGDAVVSLFLSPFNLVKTSVTGYSLHRMSHSELEAPANVSKTGFPADLPEDVLLHLFTFLGTDDVLSLRQVCLSYLYR
jgi:hypothetical protein